MIDIKQYLRLKGLSPNDLQLKIAWMTRERDTLRKSILTQEQRIIDLQREVDELKKGRIT